MRTRIGVKGKIGVYGRSLGCVAAVHMKNHVDVIITDRGFCDLWTVAEEKFYGSFALNFFKYSTGGWRANNGYKFVTDEQTSNIDSNKCYKIILCDKADEIVNL